MARLDIATAQETSFLQAAAFFLALLATAFALGGALAHALELPAKIGMTREDYFVVQRVYAGWDKLALVLGLQLIGMVALAWLYRARSEVLVPVLVALAGLIAAQVMFWIWTFPANVATDNWTVQPDNWEQLRRQWEYSHFAGACFQLLAMAALIVAAIRR